MQYVFKYQLDLHFSPKNQRITNKIIDYVHHLFNV